MIGSKIAASAAVAFQLTYAASFFTEDLTDNRGKYEAFWAVLMLIEFIAFFFGILMGVQA